MARVLKGVQGNSSGIIKLKSIPKGIDSASLCSLAGRYDNPIPTRFLSPHRLFYNSRPGREKEYSREYRVIYRGPGFLTVVCWLLPPPPTPVSMLDRRQTGRLRKRYNLLTGEGGGKGGGKSNDGEKASSSINNSILSRGHPLV